MSLNFKNITVILFALFTIVCLFLFIKYYQAKTTNDMDCRSFLIVKNEQFPEMRFKSYFHYKALNNQLRVRIEGELQDGVKTLSISRIVYFDKKQNDEILELKTRRVIKSKADNVNDELLMKMIPEYYISKNYNASIYAYRYGKKDYVLSTGAVPSMYCYATH